MARAGIYRITVRRTGKPDKYYIGQSSNLHDRQIRHAWELRNGCHRNPALQAAFDTYGATAFIFEILEECESDKSILALREKAHIDAHDAANLYNVNIEQSTSSLGTKRPEATRRKMSIAQKAVGLTDARKAVLAAMTAANTGRKLTPESIAKRTAKQTGIKRSEETKRKMALAKIGRTLSEETRHKISETKKARGQCPPRP